MDNILTIKSSIYGVNKITNTIDKYYKSFNKNSGFYHYMMNERFTNGEMEDSYTLRFPGYTIGAVYVDDEDIITDIKLSLDYFKDSYTEGLEKELKQFIGDKLIIMTKDKKYSEDIIEEAIKFTKEFLETHEI